MKIDVTGAALYCPRQVCARAGQTLALGLYFLLMVLATPALSETQIWQGKPLSAKKAFVSGQLEIIKKGAALHGSLNGFRGEAESKGLTPFTMTFYDPSQAQHNANIGELRGYWVNGELRGHWVQPKLSLRTSSSYATPVRFTQNNGRYTGTVTPMQDTLTILFKAEPISENRYKLAVFVPEHNGGRYFHNAELVFSNLANSPAKVSIVRQSGDEKDILSVGAYFHDEDAFELLLPYWGGVIRFEKSTQVHYGLTPIDSNDQYTQPQQKADGWPVGNADALGVDSQVLQAFANERRKNPAQHARAAQLEAFLVARNGSLVFEDYFRGFNGDKTHDLRSASKSLTGILPGLIGGTELLSTPVFDTLGQATKLPWARQITLEHALSMSTGLDCDDTNGNSLGNEDTLQSQFDWVKHTLSLYTLHPPGRHFAYCSGSINLAGPIVSELSGQWIPQIMEDKFAIPLQIHHYHMNLMPDNQQAYSGGGLYLSARDFLKLGQVMLNKGMWQGQRILPAEYVNSVLTIRGEMFGDGYGLGWWRRIYTVDGKDFEAFYAGGNGGQQLMIVPELALAVVYMGSAYNTAGTVTARDKWFADTLLTSGVIKVK